MEGQGHRKALVQSLPKSSGLVTTIIANSLRIAWKWGALIPKWLSAEGTKRILEDVQKGWAEFLSFLNLAFSVAFRTKSKLLHEVDKHDFVNP